MDNYTVYKHTAPNGKVYIGLTKLRPEQRWGKNGQGYKNQPHFNRAIQKYEWDNIQHEIIATNLKQKDAMILERKLIREYNSTDSRFGYNDTSGGELGNWKYISLEELNLREQMRLENLRRWKEWNDTRKKQVVLLETGEVFDSITNAAKYINRPKRRLSECINKNKGYHGHWEFLPENYSEEWRIQRLKERTEKPKKEPYVNPNGYHKWSDDAKLRNKGRGGKPVVQLTLTGEKIAEFASSTIAADALGLSHGKIRMVCNGERHKHGGYRWKWKDNIED